MIKQLLTESFQHMQWADAKVWKVFLDLEDKQYATEIDDKLYHLHTTQRAFFQIWQRMPLDIPEQSSFASLNDMLLWVKEYYDILFLYLDRTEHKSFNDIIAIPWAGHLEKRLGTTPDPCTLAQSMVQVITHSTYHRGQVNMLLRKSGVAPPMVDYIFWIWTGKPQADWD